MVNARSGVGTSPLAEAVMHGHVATVRYLIGAGADLEITVNENNATVLYLAAREGHAAVVQVRHLDRSVLSWGWREIRWNAPFFIVPNLNVGSARRWRQH